MSEILDMKENINPEKMMVAANYIKEGKLVIFPTETVYGIGANGLDECAVKSIFVAKGRAQDNPLILHISDIEMIDDIACDLTEIQRRLIDIFFPGPLTIILKRKKCVPDVVTGGLDTVGIRMPSNKIANSLIKYAGVPIAAPSANISGKPSGTNIEDIKKELGDKVSCIIDGGNTDIGLESTVITVIDNKVKILRPGKITIENFKEYGFEVELDKNIFSSIKPGEKVLSPGMKYKHYAPSKECILIYSDNNDKFIKKAQAIEKGKNVLVVCNHNNLKNFKNTMDMGSSLEEISHNIFHILRQVDKTDYELIVIEGVKKEGLGIAIMNRLIRACSHNYIEL